MSNSTFIVDCNECSFKERCQEYEETKNKYSHHHTVTGHRPDIKENFRGRADYTVKCDRCSYRENTNSYSRAEDLKSNHHIPTGHNPTITDN